MFFSTANYQACKIIIIIILTLVKWSIANRVRDDPAQSNPQRERH